MKGSYKTTITGILTAVFAFVAFSPDLFKNYPAIVEIAKFAMVGGLAGIGITAKDKNVTGGNTVNPANDPSCVKESLKD